MRLGRISQMKNDGKAPTEMWSTSEEWRCDLPGHEYLITERARHVDSQAATSRKRNGQNTSVVKTTVRPVNNGPQVNDS